MLKFGVKQVYKGKWKFGLSTELMMWIGRRAEIGGLAFRALARRQREWRGANLRSDEELTLEASAFRSLCRGQFALSTPLINQIFVYPSPTDAAPQFLQKLIPFTHFKFWNRRMDGATFAAIKFEWN